MNKTLKSILKYTFFVALGAGSVWFAFRQINIDDFFTQLEKLNKGYVFLTMLVGVFAVVLRGLRWNLMLRPMGYKPSNANAYHSVMSGYLINSLIPRGGELSRCALMSRADNIPLQTLIGTVITERIIDLLMVLVVCLGATLWQADALGGYMAEKLQMLGNNSKTLTIYAVVAVVVIIAVIIIFRRIKHIAVIQSFVKFVNGFTDGIKSVFRLQQRGLFILYTLGIWFCYWCTTQFTYYAFPGMSDAGWEKGLTTLVFSSIGVIIPAPGGAGALPAVQYGLENVYHVNASLAVAFATVLVVSQALVVIISGTFSFAWLTLKARKMPIQEPVITETGNV